MVKFRNWIEDWTETPLGYSPESWSIFGIAKSMARWIMVYEIFESRRMKHCVKLVFNLPNKDEDIINKYGCAVCAAIIWFERLFNICPTFAVESFSFCSTMLIFILYNYCIFFDSNSCELCTSWDLINLFTCNKLVFITNCIQYCWLFRFWF